MNLLNLKLETLGDLEGGVIARAFDAEVLRTGRDVLDREHDDKERTVTLTVKIKPDTDSTGKLLGTKVQCFVKGSIPDRRSEELTMHVSRDGIAFNPDNTRDYRPTLNFNGEAE